jgi:hypothetical protein
MTMNKTTENGMKVGDHQFPKFDGISTAFGADQRDYPSYDTIPEQFHCCSNTPFNKAFSGLFFHGGKLSDFDLSWKAGIDQNEAMRTIRALMCSWAPKHEVKEATVAWALSEWCDHAPEKHKAA